MTADSDERNNDRESYILDGGPLDGFIVFASERVETMVLAHTRGVSIYQRDPLPEGVPQPSTQSFRWVA